MQCIFINYLTSDTYIVNRRRTYGKGGGGVIFESFFIQFMSYFQWGLHEGFYSSEISVRERFLFERLRYIESVTDGDMDIDL